MNNALRKKLLAIAARDQEMRKSAKWDVQIDKANTKTLKKIIQTYGWPHRGMVGKKGSEAAWLIAQHADHDLIFQKQCLKYMTAPAVIQYVSSIHTAYLTDRIRVNQKKKQLFGTQFYTSKNKRFLPRPIADRKNLDRRRRKMGLEPFLHYRTRLHKKFAKYLKK